MLTQQRTQPARPGLRAAAFALREMMRSPHTVAGALLAVLLLRLGLGLLALPVSAAFPDTALEQQVGLLPGGAPLGEWLQRVAVQPWQRYDAWNYVRIVEHGYRLEDGTAAFHPLFPLLAAPLARLLGGNALLALLLVATVAAVALCVAFARYVRRFHPDVSAGRAAWLLLLAPPAFILLAPYTEGLFIALAVGCLWAMRVRRWWLAGLFGALATLTRQQGIALALPLAYCMFAEVQGKAATDNSFDEANFQGRETRVSARSLPALLCAWCLVPAAYALFVAYRAVALGDLAALGQASSPIAFLWNLMVSNSSEHVVAGQRFTWPWVALSSQAYLIATTANNYDLAIDLALGLTMAAAVVLGLRRLHITERLYSLAALGLALCYYNGDLNPCMALPRHILIIFPLYIALAQWVGRGDWGRRALIGLLMLNVFLCGAFIRHGWVP
jgi:hypothetical protein